MKFFLAILLAALTCSAPSWGQSTGDVQLGVKSSTGPLEPVWITKTANRALGWNESGVLGPVTISGGSGSSAWADITGKPTTLAGYGIVDSITAALAASTYQPLSSNLTTYSGITPSANVQALLGAANYAAFKASLSLGNVENTALSTWAGSTNLTTLGTVSAGTWNGSIIAPAYLGTGSSISAKFLRGDGTWQTVSATGGTWGTITGTLADQTDLQTALNAKLSTATAASTYQPLSDNLNTLSAGLGFTLGAQLVTWDGTTYAKLNSALQSGFGGTGISIYATGDILYATGGSLARLVGNTSTTKKYLTQTGDGTASAAPVWEALGTLATQNGSFSGSSSGTNTGDQTITLLGDVTGSGTGTFTATLPTVNSNVGSFGSATAAPAVTVNAKGLITGVTTNTITPAIGSITGLGTGIATALAIAPGNAGAPVLFNGAGGTPSSITLTNGTALPVSGITSSTSTALGLGSIELGHASDTTLARSSAGNLTVEGQALYRAGGSFTGMPVELVVPCSNEADALTTGAKFTFRMPHGMTLTSVLIEVSTAPTGSVIIVDVKKAGTTIFSTKPQIAISAFDSYGGAVPGVLSTTSLAFRDELTFWVDQIGSTIAGKGLKVTLIGTRQ